MNTSVLIFEDNNSLRDSLFNLLQLDGSFSVLGSFPNCMDAEVQVQKFNPDVILMDIDMPGRTGIEAVQKIRAVNKNVQIIMLTVFDDSSHVYDAIYAGANGYLLKKNASDKLINSIREVLHGGAPMSPTIARMVVNHMQQPSQASQAPAADYQLTPREKEILQSLSRGNSFKLIAAELGISLDTVRTHIKRIYDKLHVRSQIEAVSKAINEKLV